MRAVYALAGGALLGLAGCSAVWAIRTLEDLYDDLREHRALFEHLANLRFAETDLDREWEEHRYLLERERLNPESDEDWTRPPNRWEMFFVECAGE